MIKLGEVYPRHQLVLHVIHGIVQGIYKLVEVLLIQEDLVFFVREPIVVLVIPLLAFSDGEVIVVGTGRLHIEEVSSLAGLNFFGIDLIPAVLVVFHKWVV